MLGDEAVITVNGTSLTTGQVMTIRVALNHFQMYLDEQGLGNDETGIAISKGYQKCADEVLRMMAEKYWLGLPPGLS